MRAPSSVEETGGLALRRAVQRRDAIAAASGGLRTALGKRTVFWQARRIRHGREWNTDGGAAGPAPAARRSAPEYKDAAARPTLPGSCPARRRARRTSPPAGPPSGRSPRIVGDQDHRHVVSSALLAQQRGICACTVTSSAVVGSSAISSAGRHPIAMAIITRCSMPPDS